MLRVLLKEALQFLDGLSVFTLISCYESQIVVGRSLLRLQTNTFSQMTRGVGQVPLEVQNGAKRILQLRVAGILSGQFFQNSLRRVELLFADFGRGEHVLVTRIFGPQAGGLGQRRLSVLKQVHFQANSTKAEKDFGIVRSELLRAHPVRQ